MNTTAIIPIYNEANHIAACLDTLLKQTAKPKRIVVVDDGSSDGSVSIVKQYQGRFPVTLLLQKHRGPGAARNLAAAKVKDGILIFVDGDMTFDKNFLKNLTQPIIKGESKGVFNLDEYVSNWDNPLARSWNYNNNLPDKRRLNPKAKSDTLDFRAILKSEFDRINGFSLIGYTDSQTLSQKLGYRPTPVSDAISYHANPSTLKEIFFHSRWIGKRSTKFGLLGKLANLVRYSLPVSLTIGIIKALRFHLPLFVPFKLVYDLGFAYGTILSLVNHSNSK